MNVENSVNACTAPGVLWTKISQHRAWRQKCRGHEPGGKEFTCMFASASFNECE
jgi:hypothetical protein